MVDLRSKILEEMEVRGYTYARLLSESGLDCDVSSLNRKLNGVQGIEAGEMRSLAGVFGLRVSSVDRSVDAAKAIGGSVLWLPTKRRAS